MALSLELSIPTTSTSTAAKPYTIYNVSVRQPLRSYTVQKRYSEFEALHAALAAQCAGHAPPAALPGKSWFRSTISSPDLTEERRKGLEAYLRAVCASEDPRWRRADAWRQFLNLPPGSVSENGGTTQNTPGGRAAASATRSADLSQTPIVDPAIWLDVHRELKGQLGDARLALRRRAEAGTAQAQHEASAEAKRQLVRSGATAAALEAGLQRLAEQGKASLASRRLAGEKDGEGRRPPSIGEGELRRRRDLLSSAKKERDGLEAQLVALATRPAADGTDAAMASAAQKDHLFQGPSSVASSANSVTSHGFAGRRVLGGGRAKETERTRELDNAGVVQLQKQIMQEQDADVDELAAAVRRMRDMGVQINQELVYQNEMLGMLDQDVERVGDKIKVAKKRVGEIS